jgi:hypothetical protein
MQSSQRKGFRNGNLDIDRRKPIMDSSLIFFCYECGFFNPLRMTKKAKGGMDGNGGGLLRPLSPLKRLKSCSSQ